MAQARDARGRFVGGGGGGGGGGGPAIAVRIRANGIPQAIAAFKAMQAQAQRSLNLMAKAALQARASLDAIAKPVRVTIDGVRQIARITAGVGALALALAGIESRKTVAAGSTMDGIRSGLEVASASAHDTEKALRDMAEKAEIDRLADQMDDLAAATFRQSTAARNATRDAIDASRRQMDLQREAVMLSRMSEAERVAYRQADATKAAELELANLDRTARRYGVNLERTARGYAMFANATKGSAAQGRVTLQTLQAAVVASKGLNLNTEQTEGVMTALAQIASKGKVSQEEILQLAERGVPAQAIAARAFGMTGQAYAKMQEQGLDASVFLDKFSRQLITEFTPAAERAASRPAAAFARWENAVFQAQAQVAQGGMSSGFASLADQITASIERMNAAGTTTRLGASVGAGLERLPDIIATVSREITWARMQTAEWFRQMAVAFGVDVSGWADRTGGAIAWVRGMLLQLAFDVPGVIYALREAFAGNDENVADRYRWVLTLRDVIQGEVMPILRQVPGIVATWGPVFLAVGGAIVDILGTMRDAFFSVFGEEMGRKIIAFLIIGKLTGILSGIAAGFSTVATVVRGVMALFTLLASPAGPVILLVAGLAALALHAYKHCETFRNIVNGTIKFAWNVIKWFLGALWDKVKGTVEGISDIFSGLTEVFTSPFAAAKKILDGIVKVLTGGLSFGDIMSGGKAAIATVGSAMGFARGGYVRGPGTGTSDSIPARLSNREGVINARATAHYGGKAFIDGLNSMRLPFASAPADVVEVGSSGRPMSFVMPGVGSASGTVGEDFADGMQRLFDKAQAGRARQKKGRGYR